MFQINYDRRIENKRSTNPTIHTVQQEYEVEWRLETSQGRINGITNDVFTAWERSVDITGYWGA